MSAEDVTLTVGKQMFLEIIEFRGSSTTYSPKDGYEEVTKKTETRFNWKLRGMSAKLDHTAEDFDPKEQELYYLTIASNDLDLCSIGFKSREKAIKSALDFAKRNSIEVDGYKSK